ncbi:MAG: ATP-binding protein [Anaerolineae bacterium]|nr:ATP-binding protein [Anaerolineae bacterium]
MTNLRHYALRTEDIIGRAVELKLAQDAFAHWGHTDVLYFHGPGGIGKTRLLEKIGESAGQRSTSERPLRWSKIIDLYLSSTHSNSGIERAICEAIDPDRHYFDHYWGLRASFERQRHEHVEAKQLESLRVQLTAAFVEGFNALADQARVLLTFDTVELVQYENDIIQTICQVPQEAIAVKMWLLETLPQLHNAVIVFAGRPNSMKLDADLRAAFGNQPDRCYTARELAGFDETETARYFAEMVALATREERTQSQITIGPGQLYAFTGGRPIRLALLIDLAVYSGADIEDLFAEGSPDQHNADDRWQEIAPRVIDRIQRLDTGYPIEDTLPYMALTRQGLDAELLYYLEPGWPLDACQQRLEAMKRFTFVKSRPDWPRIYLHDEMYDLLDDPKMKFRPIEDRVAKWKQIARFYQNRLAAVSDEDAQQNVKIDILHYELRAEPRRGFERYFARWDEEAIKAALVGFDMRLRDEFLRFFQQPGAIRRAQYEGVNQEAVNRDSAIRWIKRHINRGDNHRAVQIAEVILQFAPPFVHQDFAPVTSSLSLEPTLVADARKIFDTDDVYFWAHLLTYYAEALIYSGNEASGRQALNLAIDSLTPVVPADEYQQWWRQRILGRAHNNRAYARWVSGRYSRALTDYRHAVRYLREADLKDELADTTNNEAFLYAVMGRQYNADSLIEDALSLRRELRLRFPLAMSLTTQAAIHALLGRPDEAIHPAEEAKRIANELNNRRALGLATLTLGQAYRMQGDRAKRGSYNIESANRLFSKAVAALEEALTIFVTDDPQEDQVKEPMRRWQALNELADTYTDWAFALETIGQSPVDAGAKRAQAIALQLQAADIADSFGLTRQALDTYDDLAQTYADSGDLPAAREWLARIEQAIPPEYRLQPGGFGKIDDPIDEYWLALGKLHLQRAIWTSKGLDETLTVAGKDLLLEQMMTEFVISVAYFEKFSDVAPRLRETLAAVYRRIRPLKGERLDHLRDVVRQVGQTYNVVPKRLLLVIEDIAGLSEEEAVQ